MSELFELRSRIDIVLWLATKIAGDQSLRGITEQEHESQEKLADDATAKNTDEGEDHLSL